MDFDVVRASFLALIQGFTEFLPISSSAHLILPSALLGWEDQGLAFDVAVHLGTLFAVVLYFRKDLLQIASGMYLQLVKGERSDSSRLGWQLVIATLPVVIAGFLLKDIVDTYFRSISVIAGTTIGFGLLLWWADRSSASSRSLQQLNLRTVLIIGFSQVLALVPGTSRSGITMTAALFCHLDRDAASRFSFLLAIPTIAGAALLLIVELLDTPNVNWVELSYALIMSMFTAYLCITIFLKLISQMGFLPFVIYRLLLGCGLLFLVLL